MRDQYSIIAKELTKRFGSFTAVDEISFKVKKGDIFGFLGANGAGKTTAMRMLTGLSKPTSGSAVVAGYDVNTQPENVKQRIGYMSQKFSLYEDLKVKENINFYGGIYGLKGDNLKNAVADLLHRLELYDYADTMVRSLPLGWKQKLAFSTAIIHKPSVVFLDEPTGGVDPITRREFWRMIYEASAEGITVFVTTHYMDEAEYCNQVAIMVDGKIEAMDHPGALRQMYGVDTMDDVFYILARDAKRGEG